MSPDREALCLAKSKHRAAQSWRRYARSPMNRGNKTAAEILARAYTDAAHDFIFVARAIRRTRVTP